MHAGCSQADPQCMLDVPKQIHNACWMFPSRSTMHAGCSQADPQCMLDVPKQIHNACWMFPSRSTMHAGCSQADPQCMLDVPKQIHNACWMFPSRSMQDLRSCACTIYLPNQLTFEYVENKDTLWHAYDHKHVSLWLPNVISSSHNYMYFRGE